MKESPRKFKRRNIGLLHDTHTSTRQCTCTYTHTHTHAHTLSHTILTIDVIIISLDLLE